ncbi:hypothetical protein [Pedobacter jejuensis]|uniref:hypothetical protein n=1 Tax=Pedobacter jejuensis TaxID=1268550 RepID=UPI00142D839B|nr:hypothetical protein [Pedobacter jejuensis]
MAIFPSIINNSIYFKCWFIPKSISTSLINLIVGESPDFFCLACTKSRTTGTEELPKRSFSDQDFRIFRIRQDLQGLLDFWIRKD